jgi:hypothetical protein
MFVESNILATLLQPNEPKTFLAYRTWELPVNTPCTEYPIRQQVMHRVLVPNMHYEVLLCSPIVCPYPVLPSTDQIINERLHEHTHIILRVSRNNQRQDYVLSLKAYARGEIEGDNEYRPACVCGSRHSIRIEPICCQHNTYITSISSFLMMNAIKVFPCFTIGCMYHLIRIVSFAIFVPSHLFRVFLSHV